MNCLRSFTMPAAALLFCSTLLNAQNDKQVIGDAVLTPSEIEAGATILYLIRFQNTGEDTSYQIVIRDTLDPRLEASSFNMLGHSHPHQIVRDGNNIVRWLFDDINLPDSTSGGPNSIGFILFSVRPKPFLAPGQTILNKACIIFDQAYSICTNEAILWIDADADVEEPKPRHSLQIVPNPNHGDFEVRTTGNPSISPPRHTPKTEWWITDINGKLVWDGRAEDIASASHQVLLERPAPGLYLLWVKSQDRLDVQQFTVVR